MKTFLALTTFGILSVIAFGLIWFFFLGSDVPVERGWYLFSFATGLTMIVLPCTLPLAFVIVPLSMGKGPGKGFGIAIAFGLGIAITLSMYGVIAAVVGRVAIGAVGAPLETVKNWLYFIAGSIAYLFALGEIGLIKWRMPSYTGAAPAFIQKQGDYLKALLLGLFLGNIGVGCPHPATPVILTRIAASGDIFYGWLLFFTHAAGRVLPLLFLAFLGIMGVNALKWLVVRKDKVERATGWGMVYVAAFILVLGLFTHAWWVNSGQHTLLEDITREETFLTIIGQKLDSPPTHAHGPETTRGLFDLPLWLGNWALVFLWILPVWWYYLRKRRFVMNGASLSDEANKCESRIQSWRLWCAVALTLLLGLIFIWVLPDRFLNHTFEHTLPMSMDANMLKEMPHGNERGMGASVYHEEQDVREGLAVNLNVAPVPVLVGTSTRLDFILTKKPENTPVHFLELEIEHEKRMHVIGVRNDLNDFFHIHPEPMFSVGSSSGEGGIDTAVLSVDHIFQNPGIYKIWSEVKKDGVVHAFGHPEVEIQGEGERSKKQVAFGRNVIVGDYQVAFKLDEPVDKGHEHDLSFDIHTLTGQEVGVEPYFGGDMHLVIIKDDLKEFIHAHPENHNMMNMDDHHGAIRVVNEVRAHGDEDTPGAMPDTEAADEMINFQVIFPEAGLYKVFAQFRPKGIDLSSDESLVAPFWIRVEEKGPVWVPTKPVLLFISLILIVMLSFAVKKYLTVAGDYHESR